MTQDTCASDIDACELLDTVDNFGLCTLSSNDAKITEESDFEIIDSDRVIKKIDKLPDLHQYFNDALESDVDPITQTVIDKPCGIIFVETDVAAGKSRDVKSSTVYSRSDSENSNIIFHKSISSGSSPTYNELNADTDYQRPIYDRTDSSVSYIQGEVDSEEYHHNHRFSMTADTLEYIRGRDDWRLHTENKSENLYRRQSSNISIREEVDSDEYHHDRKLSDLIEIAYLDSESITSLPSSFEGDKVFDRYYLELQRINGQLSSDIERQVAQKQVIVLHSNQMEATEGYLYPLPDIILDQVSDNGGESYTVEQLDSDYSNLSDSEDDIQSVIEVSHGSRYEGEFITTLDMDDDTDEMIEVTLWDLNQEGAVRDLSSKESSVEILNISNENLTEDQLYVERCDELLLVLDGGSKNEEITNDISEVIATDYTSINKELITTEIAYLGTEETATEDILFQNETLENSHKTPVDQSENIKIEKVEETARKGVNERIVESAMKSVSPLQIETKDSSLHTLQQNQRLPTLIEISKSFIERENMSLTLESDATYSHSNQGVLIESNNEESTNDLSEMIATGDTPIESSNKTSTGNVLSDNPTKENSHEIPGTNRSENIKIEYVEKTSEGVIDIEEETTSRKTKNTKEHIVESSIKSASPFDQNQRPPTSIEISKSFIEQENLSLTRESGTVMSTNSDKSKKAKKISSNDNMDDLIQEGSMGVWFHK